jgi:peptidyl-prolyl cis-trans isomerase C
MQPLKPAMLVASVTTLLLISACSADKDAKSVAATSKEPIAATVNGTPITQRAVDTLVKQAVHSGQPDTPETRKVIIDRLALQAVIAQEAIAKGLDKTPAVAEQIDTIKQTVLANAYVQDLIKNSNVTDDMLKAEYDRIKGTVTGTEYKARHILVEKESEAKAIIVTLRNNPGAFEQLAKDKSKDQGSRASGGELGWFDPGRMVPEFGAAVTKLEKGKFTQVPVKTQYGYHVILLEDSKPIEAPPIEEVKAQLSQQMQQQNVMKQLDALKAKAKIEVVEAPPSAPSPPASAAPK